MTWEAAISAALSASVALNIGLILRAKGLAELRNEVEKARTADRHRARAEWQNEVDNLETRFAEVGEKVERLTLVVRELVRVQQPDLIKRIEL